MSIDSQARQLIENAMSIAQQALLLVQGVQATATSLTLQAAEDIPAGYLVNLYPSGTTTLMRLADASYSDRPAHGFAPTAIRAGHQGTFFKGGVNTAASFTQFLHDLWLSDTSPGMATSTAPSTIGHLQQHVGMATPDAGMIVDISPAILL